MLLLRRQVIDHMTNRTRKLIQKKKKKTVQGRFRLRVKQTMPGKSRVEYKLQRDTKALSDNSVNKFQSSHCVAPPQRKEKV